MDLPFRALKPWLHEQFGRDVHRIALDAGSSCPNRDGSKGLGGCVYCDVEGSGTGALRRGDEISAQLERGFRRISRRTEPGGGAAAIAYFQSYSNTYVDLDRLRGVLDTVEPYLAGDEQRIVALSIATRPDTIPDEALDLLASWNERVPTWIELGLEVADDRILLDINRLHTVVDFERAVERVRARGLRVVGHSILGLPGDGREGARRTAACLARTGVDGVKVHQLMVLERTALAHWWRDGRVEPLELETYLSWLADFVERLAPHQVLDRITGDSPAEKLLAPHWGVHKSVVRERLAAELHRRGTRQGALCAEPLGR